MYTCRGGEHELLLVFTDPSRKEIEGVQSGEVSLALYVEQPVIVIVARFGRDGAAVPWSDAAFSIRTLPAEEQKLPPLDEEMATFRIVLVDAGTGVVSAMRVVLLAEEITAALHAAIREQASAPWDRRAFDRKVAELQARFTSDALARAAKHLTTLPAKDRGRPTGEA